MLIISNKGYLDNIVRNNLLKCFFCYNDNVIVMEYKLNDRVIMKKVHPCGNNEFEIIRLGADIKVRCTKCNRVIMLPRVDFNKRIKKVINCEKEKN